MARTLFDLPAAAPAKKVSKRKKKVVKPELNKIQLLIHRRRWQMVVHSAIYYHLHTNIIDDHLWQEWAEELAQLQNGNPDLCKIGLWDEEFKDWDGSTGMHLPYTPDIQMKAEYLIEIAEKYANRG